MYVASPSPHQLCMYYVSAIAHYKYLNAISVMTQAASSASVVKDLLVAAAEGRLHEVQSLLDGGRCRVNDEDKVCTSRGSTLAYSRVECCVLAVCVCLSSKSRNGFGVYVYSLYVICSV